MHDPAKLATFREISSKALQEFGGKALIGNPAPDKREDHMQPVTIVVEFPDIETARRSYEPQGYTDAHAVRMQAAQTDLMTVEGL